jgi:hypothetical protein
MWKPFAQTDDQQKKNEPQPHGDYERTEFEKLPQERIERRETE